MNRPRVTREKPDVGKAKADLARLRERRKRIKELVDDHLREQDLNSFTANIVTSFRGGRP